MAGLEKEAKKVVEQATRASSTSAGGKKASGGKKKGEGSGAVKAKRARELLNGRFRRVHEEGQGPYSRGLRPLCTPSQTTPPQARTMLLRTL